MGGGHGLDARTPGTLHIPPVFAFGEMPFFLLIFILKKLFELLRILQVGAAVGLRVKHTQPSSSTNLISMVLEEFHFLLGESRHGDGFDSVGRVEASQHSGARRADEAAHRDVGVCHPGLVALEAVFVYPRLGQLPDLAGADLLVVPVLSVGHGSMWPVPAE